MALCDLAQYDMYRRSVIPHGESTVPSFCTVSPTFCTSVDSVCTFLQLTNSKRPLLDHG